MRSGLTLTFSLVQSLLSAEERVSVKCEKKNKHTLFSRWRERCQLFAAYKPKIFEFVSSFAISKSIFELRYVEPRHSAIFTPVQTIFFLSIVSTHLCVVNGENDENSPRQKLRSSSRKLCFEVVASEKIQWRRTNVKRCRRKWWKP